ncbi:MAG: hypothetical protein SWC96_08535 [Thermodesulfobacteriota bacterium]|nr:hypothetical protein [Thermodesulfobacteriota bacterium]
MAEYTFAKELLNITSEKGVISSNEIYDLAVKHQQQEAYKALTGALVYDGYVNTADSGKSHRFNSPILRKWWKENVAN